MIYVVYETIIYYLYFIYILYIIGIIYIQSDLYDSHLYYPRRAANSCPALGGGG